jgi:hypothetical protein
MEELSGVGSVFARTSDLLVRSPAAEDPTDGDLPVVTPESTSEPIPSRISFRQSDESWTSVVALLRGDPERGRAVRRVAFSAPGLPGRASRAPIGSN